MPEEQKMNPKQDGSSIYILISIDTGNENKLVPLDNFYVYEVVMENQVRSSL